MIFGIGTDIVDSRRIATIYQQHTQRFVNRILAGSEQSDFANAREKTNFLAKRFAAKEAIAKALGTGIGKKLSFNDIRIFHNGLGQPQVELLGPAASYFANQGVAKVHLSLSDEQQQVIAFAIAESK